MVVILPIAIKLGQPPTRALLAKIPLAILPQHVKVANLLLVINIIEIESFLCSRAVPITGAKLTYFFHTHR